MTKIECDLGSSSTDALLYHGHGSDMCRIRLVSSGESKHRGTVNSPYHPSVSFRSCSRDVAHTLFFCSRLHEYNYHEWYRDIDNRFDARPKFFGYRLRMFTAYHCI